MPKPDTNYKFRNWDRTLKCQPQRFYQPESEQEVVEIVRQVKSAGGCVRTFGAGHSWSPLVLTDDTLVNLDKLKKPRVINVQNRRVTVQSGIRLKNLTPYLADRGLGLANLGSIREQSIAGAISTGTHGTGLRLGNLATQIVGLKLVTGTGDFLAVTEENEPDLMRAARVNLGALGIITEVTIQCVPNYEIEFIAYPLKFDDVLDQLDTLNRENERVRLYWFAPTDIVLVMTMNPPAKPAGIMGQFRGLLAEMIFKHDYYRPMIESDYHRSIFHPLKPDTRQDDQKRQTSVSWFNAGIVGRYDRMLTIPMPPKHQESEYAVPVERTVEALQAFKKLIDQKNYILTLPVEVRFVAEDENMLSPSYGRDVCYIGAYTFGDKAARELFAGFEPLMKSHQGRPHWGKHLTLTRDEAMALYPRYEQFNEVRKELDPAGVFANEFIRQLFD